LENFLNQLEIYSQKCIA